MGYNPQESLENTINTNLREIYTHIIQDRLIPSLQFLLGGFFRWPVTSGPFQPPQKVWHFWMDEKKWTNLPKLQGFESSCRYLLVGFYQLFFLDTNFNNKSLASIIFCWRNLWDGKFRFRNWLIGALKRCFSWILLNVFTGQSKSSLQSLLGNEVLQGPKLAEIIVNPRRNKVPGDSIRDQTSSPNVGGHQQPTISKGSRELTIPKRSQTSQNCPVGCFRSYTVLSSSFPKTKMAIAGKSHFFWVSWRYIFQGLFFSIFFGRRYIFLHVVFSS